MPEKSGMDPALCAPLPVGPTAGVTACPKAAVTEAATAANVANKRKSRRRTPMATSLSWFRRHLLGNVTAVAGVPILCEEDGQNLYRRYRPDTVHEREVSRCRSGAAHLAP